MLHTPGPLWISGLDFREQPGIADHVNHYRGMLEEGRLYLGGPFLAVDAGGMMITRTGLSREEVEAYAADDPAVAAGLLRYEIRSWYVVMDANRKQLVESLRSSHVPHRPTKRLLGPTTIALPMRGHDS